MFFLSVSVAEKYNYLEEESTYAYKWLAEADIRSLAAGSYPIMGNTVVTNVQEYITFPANQGSFETHKKYFDIQYMMSDREQFGMCKRDGLVEKKRNEVNDLILYEEPEFLDNVFLEEGGPIVVTPEDTRESRYQVGRPRKVKRAVVKVAL